ncbi:MAG: hypothetical protein SNJ64_03090 [Endomicrobiia bacterium]
MCVKDVVSCYVKSYAENVSETWIGEFDYFETLSEIQRGRITVLDDVYAGLINFLKLENASSSFIDSCIDYFNSNAVELFNLFCKTLLESGHNIVNFGYLEDSIVEYAQILSDLSDELDTAIKTAYAKSDVGLSEINVDLYEINQVLDKIKQKVDSFSIRCGDKCKINNLNFKEKAVYNSNNCLYDICNIYIDIEMFSDDIKSYLIFYKLINIANTKFYISEYNSDDNIFYLSFSTTSSR